MQAKIVEDEQILFFDFIEFFVIGAVSFGKFEFREEFQTVKVQDSKTFETGLMANGWGDEAFADAGSAANQDIFSLVEPLASGESEILRRRSRFFAEMICGRKWKRCVLCSDMYLRVAEGMTSKSDWKVQAMPLLSKGIFTGC